MNPTEPAAPQAAVQDPAAAPQPDLNAPSAQAAPAAYPEPDTKNPPFAGRKTSPGPKARWKT